LLLQKLLTVTTVLTAVDENVEFPERSTASQTDSE
jgi:hypothetical protein